MANGGIIGPTQTVSNTAGTAKVTSITSSKNFTKDPNNIPGTATVLTVAGGGSAGAGDTAGGAVPNTVLLPSF